LVSLGGLVGSDRWVNKDELEAMDPNYSSSVHVRSSSNSRSSSSLLPTSSSDSSGRARFAGIENSVDTSWSFQYATFPFLHGKEDSIVFLGQCYLLGEELTPLLVNMKGVVEQVSYIILLFIVCMMCVRALILSNNITTCSASHSLIK